MAFAARRYVGVVGSVVAQQAFADPGPAPARSPGGRAPADCRSRRTDRKFPPWHARRLGPELGNVACPQPWAGDAKGFRLRPDRPVSDRKSTRLNSSHTVI